MNLIIEYFTPKDIIRNNEYIKCIDSNLKSNLFSSISIFTSLDSVINFSHESLKIIRSNDRPNYNDLFNYCNINFKSEICIISNADIIFDKSLLNCNIDNNDFIALTRWDILYKDNKYYAQFFDHPWNGKVIINEKISNDSVTTGEFSQDCWIFRSPIRTDDRCDFTLGKPGCDNRIAYIYNDIGYNVCNPSLKILTKHLHISNYRTYTSKDMISGPYLLVKPSNSMESEKKVIDGFYSTI